MPAHRVNLTEEIARFVSPEEMEALRTLAADGPMSVEAVFMEIVNLPGGAADQYGVSDDDRRNPTFVAAVLWWARMIDEHNIRRPA